MNSDGLWGLLITGTLYIPDDAAPSGRRKIVFQRTHPDFGNLPRQGRTGLQRRRHVIPRDPKTPYQIALRARIADATNAWHAADESTREAYRLAAEGLRHTGFNQWVADWCASHILDPADYQQQQQALNLSQAYVIAGKPFRLDFIPAFPVRLNLA